MHEIVLRKIEIGKTKTTSQLHEPKNELREIMTMSGLE